MAIVLYGIPNCDTVKKARAWLADRGVAYQFHDFRKQGVPTGSLDRWIHLCGWEQLLNRQGTTWRKLEPREQAAVIDGPSAKAVMLAHPSVIKRPVVEWDGDTTIGFDAKAWSLRAPR